MNTSRWSPFVLLLALLIGVPLLGQDNSTAGSADISEQAGEIEEETDSAILSSTPATPAPEGGGAAQNSQTGQLNGTPQDPYVPLAVAATVASVPWTGVGAWSGVWPLTYFLLGLMFAQLLVPALATDAVARARIAVRTFFEQPQSRFNLRRWFRGWGAASESISSDDDTNKQESASGSNEPLTENMPEQTTAEEGREAVVDRTVIELQREVANLTLKEKQAKSDRDRFEQDRDRAHRLVETKSEEVAELQRVAVKRAAELTQAQAAVTEARRLRDEVRDLKHGLETRTNDAAGLTQALSTARREHSEMQQRLRSSEAELQRIRDDLHATSAKLEQMQKDLAGKNAELVTALARLTEIEDACQLAEAIDELQLLWQIEFSQRADDPSSSAVFLAASYLSLFNLVRAGVRHDDLLRDSAIHNVRTVLEKIGGVVGRSEWRTNLERILPSAANVVIPADKLADFSVPTPERLLYGKVLSVMGSASAGRRIDNAEVRVAPFFFKTRNGQAFGVN